MKTQTKNILKSKTRQRQRQNQDKTKEKTKPKLMPRQNQEHEKDQDPVWMGSEPCLDSVWTLSVFLEFVWIMCGQL